MSNCNNKTSACQVPCTENPSSTPRRRKAFGLRQKPGQTIISQKDWKEIRSFIKSKVWWSDSPAIESDLRDPLTATNTPYGAFMMGFDFHLTEDGPKLIEINTNAGGLATALEVQNCEKEVAVRRVVEAFQAEYRLCRGPDAQLHSVAIVDENVSKQQLYPEMLEFASLLENAGIQCVVVSPEQLVWDTDSLSFAGDGRRIDFLYNRLTDFRLVSPSNAHIREAALADRVLVSPHPALYSRTADKRQLIRLSALPERASVVVDAQLLNSANPDEWWAGRKTLVFKPVNGRASQGVYRGDKISKKTLSTLNTEAYIAQTLCTPPTSGDSSKYDVRVFTHGTTILGIASRHFSGQVMEQRSELSGFREALPEGVCCFAVIAASEKQA